MLKELKKLQDIKSEKDPLKAPLQKILFLWDRPTYELVGDITGSIYPYITMSKKIYGAAKSGNLWQKGPGKMAQSAGALADRLPGRLKLFGGALKLLARVADVTW